MKLIRFYKKLFFLVLSFVVVNFCCPKLFAIDYYWENPERISVGDCRFPKAISNSNSSAVLWQEVDEKQSVVYISALVKIADSNGKDNGWKTFRRFAGPFNYSGEVPDMYSAAINSSDKICVCVLAESNMISVFALSNGSSQFTRSDFGKTELPLVAPRIYAMKSGDFILFTSLGKDESFSMLTSKSRDGETWNNFTIFEPTKNLTNPFLPVLATTEKGEILFFQAQHSNGTRLSYQLYSTRSKSNGTSWTAAELVTDQSTVLPSESFTSFHNQRPSILSKDGKFYIAWERTYYNSENSNICFAEVEFNTGKICSQVEKITTQGNASRPILFDYQNLISLVWFDNRQGTDAVYFSQKEGALWNESKISTTRRSAIFSSPMITNLKKQLAFVWQSDNSIYRLESDTSVLKPQIIPVSYRKGMHSKDKKVKYRIVLPEDSSGIAGYSWIWTNDKSKNPPEVLNALPKEKNINVEAFQEGEYFFKVCAMDYAGNWSEVEVISYYLDLTPPPAPKIILPELDKNGFAFANSFSINWICEDLQKVGDGGVELDASATDASATDVGATDVGATDVGATDVAGYSWTIKKVENFSKEYQVSKKHPASITDELFKEKINELNSKYTQETLLQKANVPSKNVMQKKNNAQFINYSNGVYIFAVRAIDQVGNVGEPSYAVIYLNKYEPFTYLSSVKKATDIFGNTTLTLEGSGFTYDGTITDIYITPENQKENAIKLRYANGNYKILSNNKISDIKLSNQTPKGKYYIWLVHSDRGLYKSNVAFSILENGTIKIEKQYEYVPSWNSYTVIGKYTIQIAHILFAVLMIFALAGIILAVRGIVTTIKDFNIVNLEIAALVKGDTMPMLKKQNVVSLKKKSGGLRLKLILFTVILVLMVSLLVSLPLRFIMVQTQEQSLSKGLEDRVNVLLESISSGTKAYMPSENVLELSYLPGQSSALEEANFVTITGFEAGQNDYREAELIYVWASNDQFVTGQENLIIEDNSFTPGKSKIIDQNIKQIAKNCKELNSLAVQSAGAIGNNIAKLNREGASLALNTDKASVERRNEIADITTQLTTRMTSTLNELSVVNSSSYPLYDSGKLDRSCTEYLFYRPVLYRSGSSQEYVRAIVFISVSTKKLIGELDAAKRIISFTAAGIALFAIIIGTICAVVLASIIVNPIRKLAKHVQMIGQTVDKEKLAGKEIVIKSKDEIGQLGDTVNEMTRGLVKAAQDEHLLMDGKVVQQTFLPLSLDEKGNKQTTANIKQGTLEFVGYYEGASGVSGDYFDYKKLDDRWHVVIKCDVSGHGVPAALLMTVVATLFRKHFENWNFNKNGTDLAKLVCTINDFIEGLGIKGKFATIILSLIDTKTGDVYLCNAGDNIVHIYDSHEKKQKVLTLQETPAAGPLPTFMVEMKGGFKLEKTHLNPGDILFLYTDGIEEATRKFRDSTFAITKCAEPGLKEGDVHANHKVGLDSEQMEPERVSAIIEAALNKKTYVLEKYHNPVVGERLEFDFSKGDGTVLDAILALCSVEKVFRFYKEPDVTATDLVRVDKKIDAYLKKCFNRYDYYCSNKQEISEESSYLYYTNLKEDEQLDDLTLVAVRM